ncbi:MAG TPA: hypothetical protein P5511_07250, partial [Candidatus Goldiibacteriota bacterium]|nr:hypothetical protein [Candidatus Goldiibacteriota bacterium]
MSGKNPGLYAALALLSIMALYDMTGLCGGLFTAINIILAAAFAATLALAEPKTALTREKTCERHLNIIMPCVAAIFAMQILKTAWLSDDAYITFRVADNFINGHGLRWNVEERVQPYTNTLWLFLVSGAYFIIRDIYASAMILSFALTAAVVLLVKRVSRGMDAFVVSLAALAFSKAFIDYSTAGLENSLTHVIMALFFMVYKEKNGGVRIFLLSFLAGLGFLNRPDSVLLFGPAMVYVLRREMSIKAFFLSISALFPVLVWEVFSVLYYGFPLPNSFYAKAAAGIGRLALLQHGFAYLVNSFVAGPLSLLYIAFGAVIAASEKKEEERTAAVLFMSGAALYLAYVVFIGGDFMSGRFIAAPFFMAVLVVSRSALFERQRFWQAALAAVMFAGMAAPYNTVRVFMNDQKKMWHKKWQITCEAEYYHPDTGLLSVIKKGRDAFLKSGPALDAEMVKRNNSGGKRKTAVTSAIGQLGFYCGPEVYVIDQVSISDAFASRLPVYERWRIGHFARNWPEGYIDTKRNG